MTMQSRKPQGEREAVFGMGWRKASARIVVGRQPLKKVLPGEILHWQKKCIPAVGMPHTVARRCIGQNQTEFREEGGGDTISIGSKF